jgi:hypothetical protein
MLEETPNGGLVIRVLRSLQIEQVADSTSAFQTVVTSLAAILKATNTKDLTTLLKMTNFALLKSLKSLHEKDLSLLEELVIDKMRTMTPQNVFENQIKVQRLINPIERKKLAAYYTKPIGLKLMAYVVSQYVKMHGHPIILSDPFLGSGLTLSETIKRVPQSDIHKIWGIEPHPLSALVAYAAIVYSLKGLYQKVDVTIGDAFKIVHKKLPTLTHFSEGMQGIIPKADVIVTNPPFTRWELLHKAYRTFLTKLIDMIGYSKYVKRRQQNLQLISLFLMDYFLKKDGLLISVLPASTFYTLYGEAAKAMLRDKYCVHGLVDYGAEPSFSIDSGFKEIILIASKKKAKVETAFMTIETDKTSQFEELSDIFKGAKLMDEHINWVDIYNIPYPWEMNWLTLFGQNPLRDLLSRIFTQSMKRGVVNIWVNAFREKRIVRGIEMYGPNFFFIPNKYWKVIDKNAENITIQDYCAGMTLRIGKEFMIPALRKPELYVNTIVPKVEHYFLSVPPKVEAELPHDIVEYIKWGQKFSTAKPAIRAFGRYWYSHVNKQINVKRPFGRVFLPDKIDPSFRKRGVFACYSDQPLTASKNFYIATFNDKLKDKVLSLWFNSSVFIAYFIVASRKISERWTRFLEEDYLRMPVINVDLLDEYVLQKLANSFDKMAKRKLPPILHQLGLDYRSEIDEILLQIMGIEDSDIIHKLYSCLKDLTYRNLGL